MSVMSPFDEGAGLTVLPPEQAIELAKQAPTDDQLRIDGLTDAEWEAFCKALAER